MLLNYNVEGFKEVGRDPSVLKTVEVGAGALGSQSRRRLLPDGRT